MIFGSVCSGIEAASAAWHPLGWRASFLAEIEAFPRAVLQHRWLGVPLHGDFTTIRAGDYGPIDLLVGGTPCQSFSVAGLRGGLDDERGSLALEYLRLAGRLRPKWLVWENVPGVLSSNGGRDFGSILGGMVELGYGFAYRVLDAQFFGVPQRRRRVFVVGCLGDWRAAAAVLFERHSLSGHPAPRREAGEGVARPLARCAPGGSGYRNDADTADNLIAQTLRARDGAKGVDSNCTDTLIAFGGNNTSGPLDVATAVNAHGGPHGRLDFESETTSSGAVIEDRSPTLQRGQTMAVAAFTDNGAKAGGIGYREEQAPMLGAESGTNSRAAKVHQGSAVRRLTPRECERLQGFPDDYTLIPYRNGMAADGPRYEALGNSMAVPVMRWIGERIEAVEALGRRAAA